MPVSDGISPFTLRVVAVRAQNLLSVSGVLSSGQDVTAKAGFSACVPTCTGVAMSTIAGVMWQSMTMFRCAFAALLVSLGMYAAAVLTNEAIDMSEYLSH